LHTVPTRLGNDDTAGPGLIGTTQTLSVLALDQWAAGGGCELDRGRDVRNSHREPEPPAASACGRGPAGRQARAKVRDVVA